MGVVGKALCTLLEKFHEVKKYDINWQYNTKEDINSCEVVFVCVPTPFKEVAIDISAIRDVLSWLNAPVIVIKSSLPPGQTKNLAEDTGKKVYHCPEFLREATSLEDIERDNRVFVGIPNMKDGIVPKEDIENVTKIMQIFEPIWGTDCIFKIVNSETTELTKFATNAYFATIVTFCNQMQDIAEKYSLSWNNHILPLFKKDPRVNQSHLMVTEERGFGGSCLPKDLGGLNSIAGSRFFKEILEYNKKVRKLPDA